MDALLETCLVTSVRPVETLPVPLESHFRPASRALFDVSPFIADLAAQASLAVATSWCDLPLISDLIVTLDKLKRVCFHLPRDRFASGRCPMPIGGAHWA